MVWSGLSQDIRIYLLLFLLLSRIVASLQATRRSSAVVVTFPVVVRSCSVTWCCCCCCGLRTVLDVARRDARAIGHGCRATMLAAAQVVGEDKMTCRMWSWERCSCCAPQARKGNTKVADLPGLLSNPCPRVFNSDI